MTYKSHLFGFMMAALIPGLVCAQTSFDNSGNSLLSGTYFIRHVLNTNISPTTGEIGEAESLAGTITFDGAGNYTVTGQLSDTTINGGAPMAINVNGTYSVNASGFFQMDNELSSGDEIYGGIGPSAITGCSTESSFLDFMVAVPMGSSVTNGSLQGTYRVVGMEYPGGDVTQTSNYTFLMNPDGAGNLGAISISGHAANVSDDTYTQSITGGTYSLSGGAGTMTFPSSGNNPLISGTKQFFVSADGNIFVSGSLSGYDIQVGILVSGSAASTTFNGTYYSAGEDFDSSSAANNSGDYYLDAYFGSTRGSTSNGSSTAVGDQRLNSSYFAPYDYTYNDLFSLAPDGSATDAFGLPLYVGAGGAARLVTGAATDYSIELDIQATPLPVSGSVVLNPLGVVNAANYVPITNPVSPGEFITLFGTGIGPATTVEAPVPYPTDGLAGVSVTINGLPAPIQLVNSGQINCIVPFEITDSYAVVQVSYNGTTSNSVTLYTDSSAPGVFTLDSSGVGDAAVVDYNTGSVVSPNQPANIGDTMELFVTGLGTVSNSPSDGAPASSSPLSYTDDVINVNVDFTAANVTFAGLAPGFAGLYQVNFVVPSIPDVGPVYLEVYDSSNGADNIMATLEISSGTAAARPKTLHSSVRKRYNTQGRVHSKANKALDRRASGARARRVATQQ